MYSMKLADIWKPKETMKDWGKTEYKIIRNWTPRNKSPPEPPVPAPEDEHDESPIKLTLSTTLRSFHGNQPVDPPTDSSLVGPHKDVDGNHDDEETIPLDGDDCVNDTDSEASNTGNHSNSPLLNLNSIQARKSPTGPPYQPEAQEPWSDFDSDITSSGLGGQRSDIPTRATRSTQRTDSIYTLPEGVTARAGALNFSTGFKSSELAKLEAIKNLEKSRSNRSTVLDRDPPPPDVIEESASDTGVSEHTAKARRPAAKRAGGKNRLSLPRRKAASNRASRKSEQPSPNTTEVNSALSAEVEDRTAFSTLSADTSDLGSDGGPALHTISQPKEKPTRERSASRTDDTESVNVASETVDEADDFSKRTRKSQTSGLCASASEDSDGSEGEGPPPTKVSRTEPPLPGVDGSVSDGESSELDTELPVVRRRAQRAPRGSVSSRLWQPRGVTRSRGDYSELDVCLSVYEEAMQKAVEGCSDQTVTTAMLTHWKYTRKEMLSLIKTLYFTKELQTLNRKERSKQRRLEQKMGTALSELRKAHGKYQQRLLAVKQAKKLEEEKSLSEELSVVTSGLKRIWSSQQLQSASLLGET